MLPRNGGQQWAFQTCIIRNSLMNPKWFWMLPRIFRAITPLEKKYPPLKKRAGDKRRAKVGEGGGGVKINRKDDFFKFWAFL